jgi:tRNA-dihydrouridine synthase 3
LNKELQIELRKKEYNFKYADKIVDDNFKARQDRKETEINLEETENSNVANEGVIKNGNTVKGEVAGDIRNGTESKRLKVDCDLGVGSPIVDDPELPLVRKKIDWKNKLYLAPLTTVGNLPFRRVCKKFGADITCGEMAMSLQILQGHQPEWALVQRHDSEDIFGIQLCGPSPQQMGRVAQLIDDGKINCDFVDINLGCPIDLVYSRGMGSGLMARKKPLEVMVRSMSSILARNSQTPLTIKMRTGVYSDKHLAHNLAPMAVKSWGASMISIHGRSREQRYTRSADWKYIQRVAEAANEDAVSNVFGGTVPIFGNGDIINYEDYNIFRETAPKVSGVMIARGALIKPWVFKEIKDQRHWDIATSERLEMIQDYVNYGLEHWGSDDKGVETTRRFLLEWLSFLHRYVPHGILASPPQRMNERLPKYFRGRTDIETLLCSPICEDWIKISEMFLGKPPDNFRFEPKHRAHAYKQS